MLEKVKKLYTPWNLLILIILLIAFILRIYKIEVLLDFHYDQGRDAKIIWDLSHNQKLFSIGPTTGLDGVFLGPFYYYLIAPFYLIGAGNPVIPSMFLSLLTVIALYVLYLVGVEIGGKITGFMALIIGTFSNHIIFSNRWLSNPTPIYLMSILIFYNFVKIAKLSKISPYWWYLAYLMVGLSLQFELASAIFYLPILLIFTLWRKPNLKIFLISSLLLGLTFIPQLVFNFKHDNILLNNILAQVGNSNSVKLDLFFRLKEIWKIIVAIF